MYYVEKAEKLRERYMEAILNNEVRNQKEFDEKYMRGKLESQLKDEEDYKSFLARRVRQ